MEIILVLCELQLSFTCQILILSVDTRERAFMLLYTMLSSCISYV